MIRVSVQKPGNPLSPSKNCGFNDKSLTKHDITDLACVPRHN
nr:hypothetical protein [Nostoc sp. ChiSLP03a]